MTTLLYRYRSLTAALGAVAIGAGALLVFPAVAVNLAQTTTAAATPGCDGTQNPFIR
jgi:hypothetical protein